MKALIATNEPRETGYRVAQVQEDPSDSPAATGVNFWTDCPDYIVADRYWYDPSNQSFVEFPLTTPPVPPVSEGTQNL